MDSVLLSSRVQDFSSLKDSFWLFGGQLYYKGHDYFLKEFPFLHLTLAMRLYYGPESGISTSSLSHTQVKESHDTLGSKATLWLSSREAEICTKTLGIYLRMQNIMLFE